MVTRRRSRPRVSRIADNATKLGEAPSVAIVVRQGQAPRAPQSTLFSMLIYVPTAQCIGEAFGVNPSDEAQRQKLSIKPTTLQSLFGAHLKEEIAVPEVFTFPPRTKGTSVESFVRPSERLRGPRRPQPAHPQIVLLLVQKISRKRSN
jgi:hypothetical protein